MLCHYITGLIPCTELQCVHGTCHRDNDTGSHCECVHGYGGRRCDIRKILLLFPYSPFHLNNGCGFELYTFVACLIN